MTTNRNSRVSQWLRRACALGAASGRSQGQRKPVMRTSAGTTKAPIIMPPEKGAHQSGSLDRAIFTP